MSLECKLHDGRDLHLFIQKSAWLRAGARIPFGGEPVLVSLLWDRRGTASPPCTFHNAALCTKCPARGSHIPRRPTTQLALSHDPQRSRFYSHAHRCCTGPGMTATLGICVILIKGERTWIKVLQLELLQNLNSLKFTFIAVLCQDLEIRFQLWGKVGVRRAPQTLISMKGPQRSDSFLHRASDNALWQPSKSQSLGAVNMCHKEQWNIRALLIPNSSDMWLSLLCFSSSPLEEVHPLPWVQDSKWLPSLATKMNGQLQGYKQKDKTQHPTTSLSFLQTQLRTEGTHLFVYLATICIGLLVLGHG